MQSLGVETQREPKPGLACTAQHAHDFSQDEHVLNCACRDAGNDADALAAALIIQLGQSFQNIEPERRLCWYLFLYRKGGMDR